jgi:hypothetical protein
MKKQHQQFTKSILCLAITTTLAAPATFAGDLRFSGFLSVGGGFVDNEDSPGYGGYNEEDLTLNKNLLGLQITGQVSDKLTATAQLIARSGSDYEVNAEWAYLTWQATDNSKIRVGRLRTPFYMYSDFLDVGYTYAWITPPREVYYLPFNSVDGIDYYTTGVVGGFDVSFQAYFGSFDDELNLGGGASAAKTRNQMGLAASLGKNWWTLRAAYHQADLSIDVTGIPLDATTTVGDFAGLLGALDFQANADKLLVESEKATFAEVGVNIDTGRFVAAAEHVEFDSDESLLSKNIREYVMVGVRTGDWLIHLTAAQAKDEATHPEAGIPANVALPVVGSSNVLIGTLQAVAQSQVEERKVLSLGVRWDVADSTALKFQIDDVDNKSEGDQKVFSVALQTVF